MWNKCNTWRTKGESKKVRVKKNERIYKSQRIKRMSSHVRIKISIITNILILRFYGYIKYIGDISMDILEKNFNKTKIDRTS